MVWDLDSRTAERAIQRIRSNRSHTLRLGPGAKLGFRLHENENFRIGREG